MLQKSQKNSENLNLLETTLLSDLEIEKKVFAQLVSDSSGGVFPK